jgi:prepilin-type N-terminal cleavage/methylation domain-containing protein
MRHSRRAAAGFTLLELLVTIAILFTAATIGFPALLRTLARFKLEGSARETAVLMQLARFEAIRHNTQAVVTQDFAARQVVAFADLDSNDVLSAGDRVLARHTLSRGIEFYGPDDVLGGEPVNASWNFPESGAKEGIAVFTASGAADIRGALRVADGRGNYLEARVDPAATGRVTVRKYHAGVCGEADKNDVCHWLTPGGIGEPGERSKPWEWN